MKTNEMYLKESFKDMIRGPVFFILGAFALMNWMFYFLGNSSFIEAVSFTCFFIFSLIVCPIISAFSEKASDERKVQNIVNIQSKLSLENIEENIIKLNEQELNYRETQLCSYVFNLIEHIKTLETKVDKLQ